jgi:proteasome alpha subunit
MKQAFTQYGGARPFGVSIMITGVNARGEVFVSDVTGNYLSYHASAIGENDEKIKEILRKKYNENMSVEEGIKFCLDIYKQILGKNFELDRFEVARINNHEKKLIRLKGEELKKYTK